MSPQHEVIALWNDQLTSLNVFSQHIHSGRTQNPCGLFIATDREIANIGETHVRARGLLALILLGYRPRIKDQRVIGKTNAVSGDANQSLHNNYVRIPW